MVFNCEWKNGGETERWSGRIAKFTKSVGHYEMFIESRSSLRVVFGKSSFGGFACLPDFHAGCYLINLKDRFWNTEKLVNVLGSVDGITVANALYYLSDTINL